MTTQKESCHPYATLSMVTSRLLFGLRDLTQSHLAFLLEARTTDTVGGVGQTLIHPFFEQAFIHVSKGNQTSHHPCKKTSRHLLLICSATKQQIKEQTFVCCCFSEQASDQGVLRSFCTLSLYEVSQSFPSACSEKRIRLVRKHDLPYNEASSKRFIKQRFAFRLLPLRIQRASRHYLSFLENTAQPFAKRLQSSLFLIPSPILKLPLSQHKLLMRFLSLQAGYQARLF
jgi:hypothetical protein